MGLTRTIWRWGKWLADQGVGPQLSDSRKKRVRLTNALSLFAAFVLLGSIPWDVMTAPRWMLAEDVIGALVFLTLPILNRTGHYVLARLLCLGLANLIVLGNVALLGRDSEAQLVHIAMSTVPFAMFDLAEWKPLAAGVVFAIVCFLLGDFGLLAGYQTNSDNYSATLYHAYSVVIALSVLLFSAYWTSIANVQAESTLRESREHYRLVTEAAGDAIITFDADKQIIFSSPATEHIFGYTPSELEGKPLSLLTAFAPEKPTPFTQAVGFRHDGTQFPIEISTGESKTGAQRIRTAIVRDISGRLRQERELEQTRQASVYSAKMAALGEMSGGIAHEVNNPLTSIMLRVGNLRRLARKETLDVAAVVQTASEVERTVVRIQQIVDALRSFARDADNDPMQPEPVLQIVSDTIELCSARFRQHDISLEVDPIPRDLSVECRPVQISQILLNLLNNAHDAVEGQPKRWVKLAADARDDSVRISISDSGPGIPAGLATRIMEPFFTTKEIGKGTGLGLSVSKGIAEAHGGTLELDASHPHTRFVLTLRRATRQREED